MLLAQKMNNFSLKGRKLNFLEYFHFLKNVHFTKPLGPTDYMETIRLPHPCGDTNNVSAKYKRGNCIFSKAIGNRAVVIFYFFPFLK